MKSYSIKAILRGIREKDNNVLHYVYKENFPAIKKHIINNSGNDQDAKDIFQDAIVIVYNKTKEDDFSLNCDFSTYLYSICKLLWLKELRENKDLHTDEKEIEKLLSYQNVNHEDNVIYDRYSVYHKYIKKLGYDCQKVLRLFYDGVSPKEIAKIMGYKNEHIIRSKKFRCKERLMKWIKNDPNFKG